MRIFSLLTRSAAVSILCLLSASLAIAAPSLDLERYAGKVVIVDFWASWCVPCRRSFPWLDEMQAKYADDGLVVIGVNEDADASEAAAFLAEFPVSFTLIDDEDGALAKEYDLVAMPSSYWLGRDGKILSHHLGFKVAKMAEYESDLRAALGLEN